MGGPGRGEIPSPPRPGPAAGEFQISSMQLMVTMVRTLNRSYESCEVRS